MCGVFTSFGASFDDDFDAALDALASRGPDERGVWSDPALPGVRLGHRRLSILDLGHGQQPMTLAGDDRYVLSYNGEIYNFRELRAELEQLGHRFRTDCDTEVLLAGYAQWGEAVLPRLDGMFALVVWDRVERRVFAARDRFGIKPLCWASPGLHPWKNNEGDGGAGVGGLVLSSTLAPFFALRGFPKPLDFEALRDFLACQSVMSPRTFLASVRSVPPGCLLRWSWGDRDPEVEPWWRVPRADDASCSWESFVERTDAALRESVRRQLVADVPLGAFLSGGIDSSLMVKYMAEESSGSGGGAVKTFSVRFPFGKGYDESGAAEIVARHFGCDHHVLDAGDIDGEAFADAVALLDQPMADPAYLPTLALSELTRQHVTVAISGDGGDELFGGYDRYLRGTSAYPGSFLQAALRSLGLRGRRSSAGLDRLLWDRTKLGPFGRTRKDMASLLAPGVLVDVDVGGTMEVWMGLLREFADPISGCADADALMRADLHSYLSENCLVKTDRASMAHGLEVRVPLLGSLVSDVALPVHADVKLAHGPKSALVELAKRSLPAEVWDRPKHGFSVPLRGYFSGAWRARGDDWVERCGSLAPFLEAREVRRRWASGREDTRTVYTLLVLLAWLDTHAIDL